MNLGHEIGFTRIILLHQLLMRSAVYSTDFVTNLALNMAMENGPFTVDLPIKDGDFP